MRIRSLSVLVPAFALAGLLLAPSCGGDAAGTPQSGAELFQNQCAMCHMRDGSGSILAPSLHGKKEHWTREKLLAYLVDPVGYAAKDPRMKTQGTKFSQAMPTYKMLTPEQLGALADHVLSMP